LLITNEIEAYEEQIPRFVGHLLGLDAAVRPEERDACPCEIEVTPCREEGVASSTTNAIDKHAHGESRLT
jgi:hypothetical protein